MSESVSAGVFLLIILASLFHAAWNFAARRAKGHMGVMLLAIPIGCLLTFPISFIVIIIYAASGKHLGDFFNALPFIIGSALVHCLYFVLLGRAYKSGNLSVVYPIARGTGVALTTLFSVLIFHDSISVLGFCGIFAIILGIIFICFASNSVKSILQATEMTTITTKSAAKSRVYIDIHDPTTDTLKFDEFLKQATPPQSIHKQIETKEHEGAEEDEGSSIFDIEWPKQPIDDEYGVRKDEIELEEYNSDDPEAEYSTASLPNYKKKLEESSEKEVTTENKTDSVQEESLVEEISSTFNAGLNSFLSFFDQRSYDEQLEAAKQGKTIETKESIDPFLRDTSPEVAVAPKSPEKAVSVKQTTPKDSHNVNNKNNNNNNNNNKNNNSKNTKPISAIAVEPVKPKLPPQPDNPLLLAAISKNINNIAPVKAQPPTISNTPSTVPIPIPASVSSPSTALVPFNNNNAVAIAPIQPESISVEQRELNRGESQGIVEEVLDIADFIGNEPAEAEEEEEEEPEEEVESEKEASEEDLEMSVHSANSGSENDSTAVETYNINDFLGEEEEVEEEEEEEQESEDEEEIEEKKPQKKHKQKQQQQPTPRVGTHVDNLLDEDPLHALINSPDYSMLPPSPPPPLPVPAPLVSSTLVTTSTSRPSTSSVSSRAKILKTPSRALATASRFNPLKRLGPIITSALAVGLSITAYSLIDKPGVGLMHPVIYLQFMLVFESIIILPYLYWYSPAEAAEAWSKGLRPTTVIVGVGSCYTYLIILYCFSVTSAGYVVALRELAVVFGSLFGYFLLSEPMQRGKVFGSFLVVTGLILVKLA